MVKWSFNMQLLSKLTNVMSLSCSEIARRCDVNQSALFHYIRGDYELPVQILIQICNTLRMPSRYFILEEEHYIIPTRETATIETNRWKPIYWNREAVELTFGDGEGKIYWKDVAEVMNVTSQKPHERFTLRRRFKVTDFLTTCNAFSLSPFRFLIDPNNINIPKHEVSQDDRPIRHTTSSTKTVSGKPSYAEIIQKMDALEHSTAELQQKFATVLKDQEALAKSINSLLHII